MLIKKILAALPLSPAPKRLPRHAGVCAGAAVHHAGRCGDVLAVDVYSRKRELLYRFYSDGRNYIITFERKARKAGAGVVKWKVWNTST